MFSGVNSVWHLTRETAPSFFEKKRDVVVCGADALLVAALIVISGLLLGNVVHLMGSVVMNHTLAYGLGGAAIGLMIFGIATSLIRWAKSTPKATTAEDPAAIHRDVTAKIAEVRDSAPEFDLVRASKTVPSHQIYKGLSLGMARAFAESTHLPLFTHETGKPVPIATDNPGRFHSIITVCPLGDIATDFDALTGRPESEIRQSFTEHQVDWLYVGRFSGDDTPFWYGLIHDCTFPTSELALKHEFKTGIVPSTEELKPILAQKKDVITAMPVAQWFEPVFKEIDRAVMGNEKVLVHCYAGQSRSATILAAYFINRFGVSAMDAANFLRHKRPCVSPKFLNELESYEAALKKERAATASSV